MVCYTTFVVCFQAVWTQWPQKILRNIKKIFRRDLEGRKDPSCLVSSICLGFLVASSVWVLFPHEQAPFITMHQVVSESVILPTFWHFPSMVGNSTMLRLVSLCEFHFSLLLLGLLADLSFREFSRLAFVYCVFSPFLKASSFWSSCT